MILLLLATEVKEGGSEVWMKWDVLTSGSFGAVISVKNFNKILREYLPEAVILE